MVVASVNYGTMNSHTGTLAEVMGVIGSIPHFKVVSIFFNGTNVTAVVRR